MLRTFANSKNETIKAVEIIKIVGPAVFHDDSSKDYLDLPLVDKSETIFKMGRQTRSVGENTFEAYVERGFWMDFSIGIDLSIAIPGLSGVVSVEGRSESMSAVEMKMSVPSNKVVQFKGPHMTPLQLALEEVN